MKKTFIMVAACSLLLSACGSITGSTGINGIQSAASTGNVIGNILTSVIGLDKVTQASLIKKWSYNGPGCAFTSENLLAKAGGEIAASKIEEKLSSQYSKFGLTASNTYIEFKSDGTFAADIKGRAWNGTYKYNESDGSIQLKGLLISLNGYVKRESGGIALLFESKKLLSLVKTLSNLSSASADASSIGSIASSYDGVRIGFDFK